MSDEVTKRNIAAILAYSKETREKFRELEVIVEDTTRTVAQVRSENDVLRQQVQHLQIKLLSGGATT